MDKETILAILRKHAPELQAAGVIHLRLFGSVAREEANPQSDVDLLADFDTSNRMTLVTISSLENRISHLLGARVELSSEHWMREHVRNQALREAVVAF